MVVGNWRNLDRDDTCHSTLVCNVKVVCVSLDQVTL
jgi:hypothetical protein